MVEQRTIVGNLSVLFLAVLAISIICVFLRPDLWVWALGFTIVTIILLVLAHDVGVTKGIESVKRTQAAQEDKRELEEKSKAEAQLESFEAVLAEADLFAYELNHGLIPDGNSESNPGYGPMDFNDWREWKHRMVEQTGNLWFNHPDGLPPRENGAA